jgi:hypothetical protein
VGFVTEISRHCVKNGHGRVALIPVGVNDVDRTVSLAILLPLVGWHSAGATVNGLLLGLAGTVFAAVVPMTYIVANVRRGRLTDHHVGVREQRRTPLLVGPRSSSPRSPE